MKVSIVEFWSRFERYLLASRKFSNGQPIDLIISPNEISFAHGTGVLLSRLIEDRSDVVVMRSRSDYGGGQRVSAPIAFELPTGMTERKRIFEQVSAWLAPYQIRSILCAPYFETDLTLAVAAQAITNAPMGLWIMDDNCLLTNGIPRAVMAEAVERASALFAISPELKRAYQTEFRKPMALLPPLVAPALIRTTPAVWTPTDRLVMIGNIWSPDLLDQFSLLVQRTGLTIEWHASNPDLWSSQIDASTLRARGLHVVQSIEPKQLAEAVATARAVIVPSDSGSAGAHKAAIGSMSWPSRMPFVVATAGTPLIVVSRPGTAAAAFVQRFGVGRVTLFEPEDLTRAVAELADPAEQARIRARAAELAPRFSFDGAFEFVAGTIMNGGRWPDERFEAMMPASDDYAIYLDKPPHPHFARDFGEVVSLCDRLKRAGFVPDFIMDVGASTAIWSLAVETVYDTSRYILCDPMFSRYAQIWAKPHFELVEAAIGAKPGNAVFSVSSDLYGSSLASVSSAVTVTDKVSVPIRTVDAIAKEKKLTGRGLLKVDVQYAEHLVIEGASKTLRELVDVVVLELSLTRVDPNAKTLLEVATIMDEAGFRIFDQIGHWRLPATGEMEQIDLVFIKKNAPFAARDVA